MTATSSQSKTANLVDSQKQIPALSPPPRIWSKKSTAPQKVQTDLDSAVSQSSVAADCNCREGYSASHSSLRSTSQSSSDPSAPASPRDQILRNRTCTTSYKNMSSFEVEREVASIMGQGLPRRVSQMPSIADGRRVPLNDGHSFDSSQSFIEKRLAKDASGYSYGLVSAMPSIAPSIDQSMISSCLVDNSNNLYPTNERMRKSNTNENDAHDNEKFSENDESNLLHEGGGGEEVVNGGGRDMAPQQVMSSSCSESAYETIRSKDRRLDEALASSFEFYCTVSKDARAVGYVSSSEEVSIFSKTHMNFSFFID